DQLRVRLNAESFGRLPDEVGGRGPTDSFVDRVSAESRVNRSEALIDAVHRRVGPGRPGILRDRHAGALRIGVLTGQRGMPERDDAAQRMRCGSGAARRAPRTGSARGCREHGQAYCQNRVDARTNLHLLPPHYLPKHTLPAARVTVESRETTLASENVTRKPRITPPESANYPLFARIVAPKSNQGQHRDLQVCPNFILTLP